MGMGNTIVTAGIICRTSDYRENDKMLTVFSPTLGRIQAIARGCKKMNSRNFAATQLFALGEFSFHQKGERLSLIQSDVRERFFPITQNLKAFYAGQFVLQSSVEIAQPMQNAQHLFELAYTTIGNLAYGETNPLDLIYYYMIQLLLEVGSLPPFRTCAKCGASTFQDASFHFEYGTLCSKCAQNFGGKRASALTLEAMYRMQNLQASEMNKVKLPEKIQKELDSFLPAYLEFHLEKKFPILNNIKKI